MACRPPCSRVKWVRGRGHRPHHPSGHLAPGTEARQGRTSSASRPRRRPPNQCQPAPCSPRRKAGRGSTPGWRTQGRRRAARKSACRPRRSAGRVPAGSPRQVGRQGKGGDHLRGANPIPFGQGVARQLRTLRPSNRHRAGAKHGRVRGHATAMASRRRPSLADANGLGCRPTRRGGSDNARPQTRRLGPLSARSKCR